MAQLLPVEQLDSIFGAAANTPRELCQLSGVCRNWRALICGDGRATHALWQALDGSWWQPLLQKDLRGRDRYGLHVYGKLEMGINLAATILRKFCTTSVGELVSQPT